MRRCSRSGLTTYKGKAPSDVWHIQAANHVSTAIQPYKAAPTPELLEPSLLKNPKLEHWHQQKRQQKQIEALKTSLQVSIARPSSASSGGAWSTLLMQNRFAANLPYLYNKAMTLIGRLPEVPAADGIVTATTSSSQIRDPGIECLSDDAVNQKSKIRYSWLIEYLKS